MSEEKTEEMCELEELVGMHVPNDLRETLLKKIFANSKKPRKSYINILRVGEPRFGMSTLAHSLTKFEIDK